MIRAIATGHSKLSAIASVLEVKQTNLSKYLKTLIDLDILEREVPVTVDNPEKSKMGLIRSKTTICVFGLPLFILIAAILRVGTEKLC